MEDLMSTATVTPPTVGTTAAPSRPATYRNPPPALRPGRPASVPPAGDSAAVRAFLARYASTLLPLAPALIALQVGWELLTHSAGAPGQLWPAAAAASGWAVAVGAWTRRRGWPTSTVIAVVAAPAAALAASAAAGWLSPAGLVLWGPVSTVLTVSLALAAQPLPLPGPRSTER
jgi:hypothetical protein